jgi:hypothetical protein
MALNFKTDAADKVEEIITVDEELVMELLEEEAEATDYSIETSQDNDLMRIQFHNEEGLLSSLTTDSAGAYEFAQRILRGYDAMEGL